MLLFFFCSSSSLYIALVYRPTHNRFPAQHTLCACTYKNKTLGLSLSSFFVCELRVLRPTPASFSFVVVAEMGHGRGRVAVLPFLSLALTICYETIKKIRRDSKNRTFPYHHPGILKGKKYIYIYIYFSCSLIALWQCRAGRRRRSTNGA